MCPDCDSVVAIAPLARGQTAYCGRCGHDLDRFQGWSARQLLAVCATAWIMLVHVLLYPLVTLDVLGNAQTSSIWESVRFAWDSGNMVVGWMTFIYAVLLPVAELAVITSALWCIAAGAAPRLLVWALRGVQVARNWNMLAVFLLGVLVALIKLATVGRLSIGLGLISLGVLVVLLGMLSRLDAHTLWRMAEERGMVPVSHLTPSMLEGVSNWQRRYLVCHRCGMVHSRPQQATGGYGRMPACVRCGVTLRRRKRHSLKRCWAFLLTALVFYVPANLMPIMATGTLHVPPTDHTILSGVVDLYRNGSVGIAIVVFIASLAVPVIKFLVLGWLLLSIQFRWLHDVYGHTWMFRLMELIGQWSMLDVFVVVLLAALVHFDGLMLVKIGPAAWSFGSMVIFTMLAAQHFDPRLLWDAQKQAMPETPNSLTHGSQGTR